MYVAKSRIITEKKSFNNTCQLIDLINFSSIFVHEKIRYNFLKNHAKNQGFLCFDLQLK